MKKTSVFIGALLVVAAALFFENCTNTTYAVVATDSCTAPSSWFPHSQTPAPAEGANSNFADPTKTTNCDFHQWAWQKFLYLTKTDSNGIANFQHLVQVDNQLNNLGNSIVMLIDSTQAGSHSVLVDKSKRAVYYAIYANQQMYDFASTNATKFSKLNPLNDSVVHSLGYDTLNYPVGSFEVKTAWTLVSSLPPGDSVNYYITNALVVPNTNGKAGMPKLNPVRVALIGMHIVGAVINHPELIWATYEHKNLAPTAVWPANYQTDSTPDPKQVLATKDYMFYKSGLTLDECSIRDTVGYPYKKASTYHLTDHGTQPNYTGNIASEQKQDSANLSNILNINKSVLSFLSKEAGPWKNYEYTGSIWIDPTVAKLQPDDSNIGALTRTNLRGSRAITNITMETYAQLNWDFPNPSPPPVETGASTPTNTMNCFGCHSTTNFNVGGNNGLGYNLALSHLFNNRLGQLIRGEQEQMKVPHKQK